MKILVRAPNWLGDAVMATPFLKRLAAKRPGAVIDVQAKASVFGVFAGMPGVRQVLSLDAPIRGEGYDEAYVLPVSFSSAWKVFRAGIPARTGHAGEFRSPLLTRAFPLPERYHYVRRYLGLIGEEGREVSPEDFYFPSENPPFPLPAGPILAVAPGSRAPARRWAAENFAEVVDGARGWNAVLLLGAAEDASHAAAVRRAAKREVVDLCGKTSLPVLAGVLKKCGALVTNESGLMHIAWAVGTPAVVVAGPSEPRCTSPFGARIEVLQRRDVPCVPCVRNDCYRMGEEHQECLKKIKAAEVVAALDRIRR